MNAVQTSAGSRTQSGAGFRAGAGTATIEIPPDGYPLDGFDGEHDPLQARVLVLDSPQRRLAVAVVDLTSVPADLVAELRAGIAGRTATLVEDVVVWASHTFSAPHVAPRADCVRDETDPVREAVHRAVDAAAADAAARLRPARWGAGSGVCGVNVNRDLPTETGCWLGANEHGVSDKTVAVLRFDDLAGRPIALLANYAVQSSIMNESRTADRGRLVTADLFGAAARRVEDRTAAGAVCLITTGAAGDQAPVITAHRHTVDRAGRPLRRDIGSAGFAVVDVLGERLGDEITRVVELIDCDGADPVLSSDTWSVSLDAQVAPRDFRDLHPTAKHVFVPAGDVELPVTILRIGDVALVAVQPELSSITGLEIKNRSPQFAMTIVTTMANGAAKYLPDAESYDRSSYEAMSARFARGSAERLTADIIDRLRRVHDASPQNS